MGQLDTRIPLGTTIPQGHSPLRTLSGLAQLEERRDLSRQRQLMNEARERDLDDDTAMRDALQRFPQVDDAIDFLYQNGRAGIAGALSEQVVKQRKAAADDLKAKNDDALFKLDNAGQILQTVTDQQSLTTARSAIRAIVGDDWMHLVPTEYGDGAAIKQLSGMTAKRSEFVRSRQEAIDNAYKAVELSLRNAEHVQAREKNKLDAAGLWTKALATELSLTTSQEEWDTRQRVALGYGAPAAIVAKFGNAWSPAAAKKAAKLGMTTDQIASADNAAANTKLREREIEHRREAEAAEGSGTGGTGRGRALTANRVSEVAEVKKRGYDEIEKDLATKVGVDGSLSPDVLRDAGQRKLRHENAVREMQGMPTLEAAEREAVERGDAPKLRQIRRIYKELTGNDAPMERVEKLFAALRAEKDPQKIADLRKQLDAARAEANALAGR